MCGQTDDPTQHDAETPYLLRITRPSSLLSVLYERRITESEADFVKGIFEHDDFVAAQAAVDERAELLRDKLANPSIEEVRQADTEDELELGLT